jgi:hypothetical protein
MNEVAIEEPRTWAKPKKLSGAERRKMLRAPLNVTLPKVRLPGSDLPRAQLATGAYGSPDYVQLRAAYRKHSRVSLGSDRWAYVQAIVHDGKQFRARLQPTRVKQRG